jgi:hypothetical protein
MIFSEQGAISSSSRLYPILSLWGTVAASTLVQLLSLQFSLDGMGVQHNLTLLKLRVIEISTEPSIRNSRI